MLLSEQAKPKSMPSRLQDVKFTLHAHHRQIGISCDFFESFNDIFLRNDFGSSKPTLYGLGSALVSPEESLR